MWEKRNAHKILVRKPEEIRPVGGIRRMIILKRIM
jgi:hypothetical protein